MAGTKKKAGSKERKSPDKKTEVEKHHRGVRRRNSRTREDDATQEQEDEHTAANKSKQRTNHKAASKDKLTKKPQAGVPPNQKSAESKHKRGEAPNATNAPKAGNTAHQHCSAPAAPKEQLKVYRLEDIVNSDKDTELEVSSMSGSVSRFQIDGTGQRPLSINDKFHRRFIFYCVGESEKNALTLRGEEAAHRAASTLLSVHVHLAALVVAPTMPCLRSARFISNDLADYFNRDIHVDPGLLDCQDRITIVEDYQQHIMPESRGHGVNALKKTPSATLLAGNMFQRQRYIPVVKASDVHLESGRDCFVKRIYKSIKEVVVALKGTLLIVVDAAPLDAAVRCLLELPDLTQRDYTVITGSGEGAHRVPIPPGSLVVLEQSASNGPWDIRYLFPSSDAHRKLVHVNPTFLKRSA